MLLTSQIIFFVSCFGVLFAYIGYPVSLVLVAPFLKKNLHRKARITPYVTFIVTAYNEEKRIREKIDNTLNLQYPRDKFQILFASDGSTDATNDIIKEYESKGIALLAMPARNGKEHTQREAVQQSTGEILVFSDVSTLIPPDALHEMVDNFADPFIGCVSSKDEVITDGEQGAQGENLYVRYEMYIREIESRVSTVVGLSGSFFAARRDVCSDLPPNMDSDFHTLLSSIRKGMRGIVDPKAIGCYKLVPNVQQEFGRKVRTVLRGITVFFANVDLLNPVKYGFFSYQYVAHKLAKWLVSFFLIAAFISNAVLACNNFVFQLLFVGQLLFYVCAISGIIFPVLSRLPFIKIPAFFVMANAAILIAWLRFLKGDRIITWQPSAR